MSYPKEIACHFIGVGGVIFHHARVLLVKLTYGPAKGRWLIPGGLVDCGETLQEAVVREILEETGQMIKPLGIIGVRSMVRLTDDLTDLYCIFLCQLESDPKNLVKEAKEIREVCWMPLIELDDDPMVPEYTRIIINKALTSQPMEADQDLKESSKKRLSLKKYEHFWVSDS